MPFANLNNAMFINFDNNKKLQLKQGDSTPIAIKLDKNNSSSGEATVYLSTTERVVIYKSKHQIKNGVLYLKINNVLPVGAYLLEVEFEGRKYPSDDRFIIKINHSAEVAPEDIVNLTTINTIENNIIDKLNNRIENQIYESLEANRHLFVGAKGDPFRYEDFTEEQLNSLKGEAGADGKSVYDLALENGFIGTQEEFLESIKGKNGKQGIQGEKGVDGVSIVIENVSVDDDENTVITFSDNTNITIPRGKNGRDGLDGENGKSAYTIAVENGYIGSIEDWLSSLKGSNGKDGIDGVDGKSITFEDLSLDQKLELKGDKGDPFKFSDFTPEQLESLKVNGKDGKSITITSTSTDNNGNTIINFSDNNTITIAKGKDGIDGVNGKSFTFEDFTPEQLELLKGKDGKDGIDGEDGKNGVDGKSVVVSSTYINNDGNTIVNFSDGTNTTILKGNDGVNGKDGKDGKSFTYNDLTVDQKLELKGDKGEPFRFEDFTVDQLNLLKGENGKDGKSLTFNDLTESQIEQLKGKPFTYNDFTAEQLLSLKGQRGDDGLSAYEIALMNGFEGSEKEWLISLQGMRGSDGSQGAEGKSAYQIAVENGYKGTESDWLNSLKPEVTDQQLQDIKGQIVNSIVPPSIIDVPTCASRNRAALNDLRGLDRNLNNYGLKFTSFTDGYITSFEVFSEADGIIEFYLTDYKGASVPASKEYKRIRTKLKTGWNTIDFIGKIESNKEYCIAVNFIDNSRLAVGTTGSYDVANIQNAHLVTPDRAFNTLTGATGSAYLFIFNIKVATDTNSRLLLNQLTSSTY